jgi:hypothetical protein
MIVRQSTPARCGRTAAPPQEWGGETSEARFFVFVDFRTERSEMTPARFDRPDRTTPHAGTTPGAQRETCIHRLGGDVRLPEASATPNPRWFGGAGVDAGGRAVGESIGQRGRTGM